MSHSTQQVAVFPVESGGPSCGLDVFEAECRDVFYVIGTHDPAAAVAALIEHVETDAVVPEGFGYGYYMPLCPPHPNSSHEWLPADATDPYAVPGIIWHF